MRLALDTNAYRELADGNAVLAETARQAETLGLPIIVIGELRFGFLNGSRLAANSAILQRFLANPRVSVLPVTDRTTQGFGEIATLMRRQGTPIQQNDLWIAALCKEHGFALATRDEGYRHVLGLQLINF